MNLKRKIKNCKRHRRNKTLSIFAEAMFNTSWKAPEYDFLVHPLIFEIIRFNHFGEICSKLRPSELIDNPFSYVLDTESLYRMPRSLSLEEQEQLSNIPLSYFTQPELEFYNNDVTKWLKEWCGIPKGCDIPFTSINDPLYLRIDKPIPPKPSVSIKEI